VTFRNDRTASVVDTAKRAFESGNYQRSLDLLAEADGLEAWSFVPSGTDSRAAIAATIRKVRAMMRGEMRA
jgi:hypothetical protein